MLKNDEEPVRKLLAQVLAGEIPAATVQAMVDGRCRALDPKFLYGHDFILAYTRPGSRKCERLVIPRNDALRQAAFCTIVGLADGGLVLGADQTGGVAELSLEDGMLCISGRGFKPGISVKREIRRRQVLEFGDTLLVGDSSLEVSEVTRPEAKDAREEENVLFGCGNEVASIEEIHGLLDAVVKGKIDGHVIEAVLRGLRWPPGLHDLLHPRQLALRIQEPDGRSRIILPTEGHYLTVGRGQCDIVLDDPGVDDAQLELVVVGESLRVRRQAANAPAYLVRRVRKEEVLDLDETLAIAGFECRLEVHAIPRTHEEGDEEKSIIFDLNAIAKANQAEQ